MLVIGAYFTPIKALRLAALSTLWDVLRTSSLNVHVQQSPGHSLRYN